MLQGRLPAADFWHPRREELRVRDGFRRAELCLQGARATGDPSHLLADSQEKPCSAYSWRSQTRVATGQEYELALPPSSHHPCVLSLLLCYIYLQKVHIDHMKIAFVYLLLAVHTVFSTAHPDFARRKRTTYPYLSSVNGLPSNGIGGHLIPDPSDTAHQFIAPGKSSCFTCWCSQDADHSAKVRTTSEVLAPASTCMYSKVTRQCVPGIPDVCLRRAANYGFLSRDGRTTMNELLSASQNLWNIGFDLATFLVAIQFAFSGNLLTGKMTIGRPDLNYASIGLGLLQPRVGCRYDSALQGQ